MYRSLLKLVLGMMFLQYPMLSAQTWLPVGSNDLVTASDEYALRSSLAYAPDGTPYIALSSVSGLAVRRYVNQQWEALDAENPSTRYAGEVALGIDSAGILYLAYNSDIDYEIRVFRLIGNVWESAGENNQISTKGRHLDLEFDSSDIPHISYYDIANDRKITVKKLLGEIWEPVGAPGIASGDADYVAMDISSEDIPYLVYRDKNRDSKATVKRFIDGAWELVGAPGFSDGSVAYCDIALSPDGVPFVTYADYSRGGRSTIQFFADDQWQFKGNPGQGQDFTYYNQIEFSPSGELYAAFREKQLLDGFGLKVLQFTDTFWSSIGNSISIGNPEYIDLALGPFEDPLVAYYDDNTSGVVVKTYFPERSDWQTAWESLGIIGASKAVASLSDLAFDAEGRAFLAYQNNDLGDDLSIRKYVNRNWEIVGAEGIAGESVINLELEVAPDGIPYIAYTEEMGAVQVKRYVNGNWEKVGSGDISSGITSYIDLKISPSGIPYVAYSDGSSNYRLVVKRFINENWEAVGTGFSSEGGVAYISLAFSPEEVVHVGYLDLLNFRSITVQRFRDGAWELLGPAGYTRDRIYEVNLEFTPDGIPTVAYRDQSRSNAFVVQRFIDGIWQDWGGESLPTGGGRYLDLAIGEDGTPYITYRQEGGEILWNVRVWAFQNGEWTQIGGRTISDSGPVRETRIVVSPSGEPFITYNIMNAYVKRYGIQRPPVFSSSATVEYFENQTTVVLDVESVDPDPEGDSEGNGLTYAFSRIDGGGVDNGYFSLDPQTGEIRFYLPPNYENPSDSNRDNTYEVQITATDSDGTFDSLDIEVIVRDIERLYVTTTGAGNRTGTSWENASDNLQAMIDVAGDEEAIWVAGGTYTPVSNPFGTEDPRDHCFYIEDPIQLFGGFAGTESEVEQRNPEEYPTILNGDVLGDDQISGAGESLTLSNSSDNLYHVVVLNRISNTSTGNRIDGVVIRGGNANGEGSIDFDFYEWSRSNGGGLYMFSSEGLELNQVQITRNQAAEMGGGIYSEGGSTSGLMNSQIDFNKARKGGGAAYFGGGPRIQNSEFTDNLSQLQGGALWYYLSSSPLDQVTVEGNYSQGFGGGMYIEYYSTPRISNSRFTRNRAATGGGAIYCKESDPQPFNRSPVLVSNTLLENNDARFGGAIGNESYSSFDLWNSVAIGNRSTDRGGVFYNVSNSSILIANCTILNNYAANMGGVAYNQSAEEVTIRNTVLYNNTIQPDPASPPIRNTIDNVNTNFFGFNNIADDGMLQTEDLFVLLEDPFLESDNPKGADQIYGTADDGLFPVGIYNPMIDKGVTFTSSNNPDPLDFTGNSRILNGRVDIGAYEYRGPYNLPPEILGPDRLEIVENEEVVLIDLEANDPEGETEGDHLRYAFTNNDIPHYDNELFSIDANTGQLAFISPPDFENPKDFNRDNQYLVQVSVFDRGDVSDSIDITISVRNVDDQAPILTCDNSVWGYNTTGECYGILRIGVPLVSDDVSVGNQIILTYEREDNPELTLEDPFDVGQTNIIWTATDETGKSSSCVQQVTIYDGEYPVAICRDFTLKLGQNNQAVLLPEDLDAGSYDNCSVTLALSKSEFDIGDLGTNYVYFYATDDSGLSDYCISAVEVISEDIDGDGVPNDIDQCPDSPPGSQVNSVGCEVFSLPATNFTIQGTGSSCPGADNGSIEIKAQQSMEYTVEITRNGTPLVSSQFTGMLWSINSLAPGMYEVCLGVMGEPDYKRCSSMTISEPSDLNVSARLISGAKAVLNLEGARIYTVRINDRTLQTSAQILEVDLRTGTNVIEVTGDRECQGRFRTEFEVYDNTRVYPNPTFGPVYLFHGNWPVKVALEVFDSGGRRLVSDVVTPNGVDPIRIDLSPYPSGIYHIHLGSERIQVVRE